jgi:hypothetical protein
MTWARAAGARIKLRLTGDMIVMLGASLLIAALYLLAYRSDPAHPHLKGDPGWWAWFDQERYFKAAQAWSRGDLTPTEHHYLPGYPLLGAPFVKLVSVHAYLVVDLICLLVSLWLFSAIASRLAPRLWHARAVGAAVFTLVAAVSPLGSAIWVVPWSTTGAAPLIFGSLLAAIIFIKQPAPLPAFATTFLGTLIVVFRPTDVVPLMLACACGMSAALLRAWPGSAGAARSVAAALAGGTLAAGLAVLAYLPIYGWHSSQYLTSSRLIGFDWGLVPLHWVTIMLDPRPLLDNGQGLFEAFPWMVPGMCGLVVFVLLPLRRSDRLMHLTVALAVALYTAVYLAYRDLHPDNLFQFRLYHYFKWAYPILAFYAVLLVHAVATERGSRCQVATVALLVACVTLPWRAELEVSSGVVHATSAGDGTVRFDSDLTSVRDGLLFAASGADHAIYLGLHSLTIADRTYTSLPDFKLVPRRGGFLLEPLRPLQSGPARLSLAPGVVLAASVQPVKVRQETRFGLPCWVRPCEPDNLIPASRAANQ